LHELVYRTRRTFKVTYTHAIGIPSRFDKLVVRGWIHTLGGEALRLYTRSTSESDSKAMRKSLLDKSWLSGVVRLERVRFAEGSIKAREDAIRF
jgi:hypothetical protein